MKHYVYLFLLASLAFSCIEMNKKNLVQGDIYVKLINIHSVNGLPNEKLEEFKLKITDFNQSNHSESEKRLADYFKILIENDLFNKPHFKLKTKEGKIINVYTNEVEYAKLTKELKNFDKYEEKISVKFEGNEIPNNIVDLDGIFNQGIFKAEKIISVKKAIGITDWDK